MTWRRLHTNLESRTPAHCDDAKYDMRAHGSDPIIRTSRCPRRDACRENKAVVVLAVATSVALLSVIVSASSTRSLVQTQYGPVSGVVSGTVRSFKGVPFAAAPTGDLRWKAPVPPTPWTSTFDASNFGYACMQNNNSFLNNPQVKVSEDCLNLNVYTPANVTAASKLPVMLFFYGGAWQHGADSFYIYNGGFDVKNLQDVIIVASNYRLDIFGFLGSKALQTEDPNGSTGNYGIQDQRLAMLWVQQNIAAFGGNPDQVTIFGESAGGGSVSVHLLSAHSNGLFHGAMIESGSVADWTAQPLYAAESKFKQVAALTQCNKTSNVVSCLRGLSAAELMTTMGVMHPPGLVQMLWLPVVDGFELTDDPRALVAAGKWGSKVPVLLGSNLDEGTEFIPQEYDMTAQQFVQILQQLTGSAAVANATAAVYPFSDYSGAHPNNTVWWTLSHAFGDSQMTCPARRMARSLAANGAPVYVYYYTHVLAVVAAFRPMQGCFHGSELTLVFDSFPLLNAAEQALALKVSTYWATFSATGNPNSAGAFTWPAYTSATDSNIDINLQLGVDKGLRAKQCDFWDAHMPPWSTLWPMSE